LSSEIVVESDSDGDNGAAEAAKEMDADVFGDEEHTNMDVDAGSEEETVAAPVKRKNRRAMIEESDEEEDEDTAQTPAKDDSPATASGDVVDTPMADTPAGDSEDE
jgi:RNA polymerase-associated protein CTR9